MCNGKQPKYVLSSLSLSLRYTLTALRAKTLDQAIVVGMVCIMLYYAFSYSCTIADVTYLNIWSVPRKI